MPKLRLEDLLRPTTDPERSNFLNQFYTIYDSGIGVHRKILNVEPLFYNGLLAGTEFLVFNINKLYLTYSLKFDTNASSSASQGFVDIMDETNTAYFRMGNIFPIFDGSTKYNNNQCEIFNVYFYRALVVNLFGMVFNGYRITLN
jgi:hypothetical protein